jgi:hypothetical protein
MSELFFDKIANDLDMPAATESTNKDVVETANSEDFLVWTMLQRRQTKLGNVRNDINDIKKRGADS